MPRSEYYSPHAAVIWCHFEAVPCPASHRLCQFDVEIRLERRRLCDAVNRNTLRPIPIEREMTTDGRTFTRLRLFRSVSYFLIGLLGNFFLEIHLEYSIPPGYIF